MGTHTRSAVLEVLSNPGQIDLQSFACRNAWYPVSSQVVVQSMNCNLTRAAVLAQTSGEDRLKELDNEDAGLGGLSSRHRLCRECRSTNSLICSTLPVHHASMDRSSSKHAGISEHVQADHLGGSRRVRLLGLCILPCNGAVLDEAAFILLWSL